MGNLSRRISCSVASCTLAWFVLAILAGCGVLSPDEELYKETNRAAYHFSPARNWSNDPNGLVYFEGEYHLFFQHNPFGNKWGHLSWGHAVSSDLVNWKELPIAIPEGEVMIFSGSAVVDWENSSGFSTDGRPVLVALYTGHDEKTLHQAQNVAYSSDKGRTWTQYAKNPVIDIQSINSFRDPKVFWHKPSNRWVMVVALSKEHKIAFYTSQNLKEWKLVSTFGPAGATEGVWECPDLFELPIVGNDGEKKWVIAVSMNIGGVAGGSGSQYFVGDFDGERFTPVDNTQSGKVRWVDFGKDFYAAQSWSDLPDADKRTVWIAWFSNVSYSQKLPTRPWRGSMTIPRSLSLKRVGENFQLRQEPIRELAILRADETHIPLIPVSSPKVALPAIAKLGATMEIETLLRPGTAKEAGLVLSFGETYSATIGYDAHSGRLFLDRSRSGPSFDPSFPGRHYMPVSLSNGAIDLHVFLDRSSIEIFSNDGTRVISDRIFPGTTLTDVTAYATNGSAELADIRAWRLREMKR
jgi:fructan beta-fructosidase